METGKKIRRKIFGSYLILFIPLLIMYVKFNENFMREIEGINVMMNGIAIPCCIVYNIVLKKDNGFLYLLFFYSILIDNTFIYVAVHHGAMDRTVPILLIIRSIIALLIIFENKIINKWVNRNKAVVFIGFTMINILVLIHNDIISNMLYENNMFKIILILLLFAVSITYIVAFIKSLTEKDFIENVFIGSVMILIIRRSIFIIGFLLGYNGNLVFNAKCLFCFALYILPTGLFVEYSCLIKEKSQLENKVKIISENIKEFKEIDKLRTQFFANISHEIKTPINIIFSGLQLIESRRPMGDQEVLEYYNKYEPILKQNCFRILRLTNNLVDMTKLESGFMKMNFKNFDIVRLVEDITMSVVEYVENKDINIIFDTLIEEKVIKCDKDGIERIILNLISNSIKFTKEKGNILVFIEMEEGYVVIKVKDDGIGIPKEDRENVFKVFVQADKSLNRAKEGSGIGLSLVKEIVKSHDGTVECADVDEGTEIVIKLPDVRLEKDDEFIYDDEAYENDMISKINTEFSDIYDL